MAKGVGSNSLNNKKDEYLYSNSISFFKNSFLSHLKKI